MNFKNIIFVLFMLINSTFSLLVYNFYSNDLILSVSIVLNLILSFYLLYKNSPEDYIVKLSIVYLMGFTLFICGRYISNIFGVENIYCFDFGYFYCLNVDEKLRLNFLINFSLIAFVAGFVFKNKEKYNSLKVITEFVNKKVFSLILTTCFITGFIAIYFQLQSVISAIQGGYSVLYEIQGETYQPPFILISNTVFLATLAVVYSLNKSIRPIVFYSLIFIYVLIQLMSVLTGARAGFITAIIVLLWLFLGRKKFNFKKVLIIVSGLFVISITNYFSSISGARITTSGEGLYEKIVEEIFYGQGISLLVFNLGSLETDYPLIAYLKTVFPGIQVFYQFLFDINLYDLSFSQSLTYRLAPSVYYNNMGWGWSLLGDFYAFSFGLSALFLLYSFTWGKVIYKISYLNDKSIYYRGLFFCFLVTVFSINRTSISYLIFIIILYTILYFSLKIVLGKKH